MIEKIFGGTIGKVGKIFLDIKNCYDKIIKKKGLFMAKVLVTIPDEFLNKVDGFADKQSCSRSQFIREALKNYMRKVSAQQMSHASKDAQLLEEILK